VVELARASINETTSGLFVKNVRLVNGRLTWDERGDREVFRTIQHALREGNPPAPIDPQVLQGAQSRVAVARERDRAERETYNTNQDIDEVLLQDEDWMDFLADLAQP